jgi:hypothetical protein
MKTFRVPLGLSVFRYLDFLQAEDEVLPEHVPCHQKEEQTMATLSATSLRAQRRARSLRLRAGAARTFGSLFVVFSGRMLVLRAIFLYDHSRIR